MFDRFCDILQHNVNVDDQARTWSAGGGGGGFGGGGGGFGGGGRGGGMNSDRFGPTGTQSQAFFCDSEELSLHAIRGYELTGKRPMVGLCDAGHDYRRVPPGDTTPCDEAKINALIAERMHCKTDTSI